MGIVQCQSGPLAASSLVPPTYSNFSAASLSLCLSTLRSENEAMCYQTERLGERSISLVISWLDDWWLCLSQLRAPLVRMIVSRNAEDKCSFHLPIGNAPPISDLLQIRLDMVMATGGHSSLHTHKQGIHLLLNTTIITKAHRSETMPGVCPTI